MKTITICGSMRFEAQMQEIAFALETEKGYNVLQCVYGADKENLTEEMLERLSQNHYAKIDLSDGIYIVNIDGYIGASVRKEIEYAAAKGKEIFYHQKEESPLGLKRGTVALQPHCVQWEQEAKEAIDLLRSVLKDGAVDIQHVGSTAIRGICAKPIIDIAVGMRDFASVPDYISALEQVGIHYRKQDVQGQHLFVMGEGDTRTHHIHFVAWNDAAWNNYINFRDYLNRFPEKVQAYDTLKRQLAAEFQNDRGSYTAGKHGLIDQFLQEARLWRSTITG